MKPFPADSPPGPSRWPVELQLLLACGQARESAANDARIDELLAGGFDWPRVVRSASRLGMLSLLDAKLAARPPAGVPPEVREVLRRYAHALHARNLQSIGELFALTDLFASRGVRLLPFKGPVLAMQAYGTLGLRPFADLDLLVRAEDVSTACDLLVSRQYVPRYALSAGQRANLLRFGCEHPFQRVRTAGPLGGTAATRKDHVDLHWNLFPPSFPIAFDPQAVWSRTETVTLGRREFETIGTDVLVLYLCAHGYAHHWNRLEWISALARLIAVRPGIDWSWVQREAARTGAERVLELGLVLAGDWLGAPVPPSLLHAARRRPAMQTLLAHVSTRILHGLAETAAGESTLNDELFFDLDARETWGRRVGYFLRRLVTPSLEDVEWVSVPARLPALYYLLRPLRLSLRFLTPSAPRPAR